MVFDKKPWLKRYKLWTGESWTRVLGIQGSNKLGRTLDNKTELVKPDRNQCKFRWPSWMVSSKCWVSITHLMLLSHCEPIAGNPSPQIMSHNLEAKLRQNLAPCASVGRIKLFNVERCPRTLWIVITFLLQTISTKLKRRYLAQNARPFESVFANLSFGFIIWNRNNWLSSSNYKLQNVPHSFIQ